MTPSTNRNMGIDVARGLLILYIVTVIHALYWLDIGRGREKSFLLFEMPCIFLLSGYSFALSTRNGLEINCIRKYFFYCFQRLERIVIPYLGFVLACLFGLFLANRALFFADAKTTLETVYSWLNPWNHGKGHTLSTLNYHLWFVTPFLVVAFLMPAIATIRMPIKVPLPLWMIACATVLWSFSLVTPTGSLLTGGIQTIVSYVIWAALGYALASGTVVTKSETFISFGLALSFLIVAYLFQPSLLNMQANKFPPNALFFLFSSVWMSTLLIISEKVPVNLIEMLYKSRWLKPFISKGYSIYLWQGIGYATAIYIGEKADWPKPTVWLAAILLTVLLGTLAYRLERIRLIGRGPIRKRED